MDLEFDCGGRVRNALSDANLKHHVLLEVGEIKYTPTPKASAQLKLRLAALMTACKLLRKALEYREVNYDLVGYSFFSGSGSEENKLALRHQDRYTESIKLKDSEQEYPISIIKMFL